MKNLCKLQAENKGQAKSAGCLPKKKSCRLLAANPWAPSACGVHPSVLITVWLPCCASCESLCVSASLCSGCFSICVCLFAYLHLHWIGCIPPSQTSLWMPKISFHRFLRTFS